jgi:large subunit ribosomal protein L22
MNITAKLSDYRQSPRKVRLVSELVKGKPVSFAMDQLSILPKRASAPLMKLLASAIANAKNNFGLDIDALFIKEFRVDGGAILYRRMPRARGTAYPIRKRTSHIMVTLGAKEAPVKAVKAKAEKTEDKKVVKVVKAVKKAKPATKAK